MREAIGDLWDYHNAGQWVVITTNGTLTYDYEHPYDPSRRKILSLNVMGAGIALQAKKRFWDLPLVLGTLIESHGNIVYKLPQYHLYTFPVKSHWWQEADIYLIIRSCEQLARLVPKGKTVYMVRPGCGAGRLAWEDVKPKIEDLLDDRFVVVERPK